MAGWIPAQLAQPLGGLATQLAVGAANAAQAINATRSNNSAPQSPGLPAADKARIAELERELAAAQASMAQLDAQHKEELEAMAGQLRMAKGLMERERKEKALPDRIEPPGDPGMINGDVVPLFRCPA